MIEHDELSAGHARALLSLPTAEDQNALARRIVEGQLSVREVERLTKPKPESAEPPQKKVPPHTPENILEQQEKISLQLGLKVRIHPRTNSSGKIEVFYSSLDEFQKLCEQLGLTADQI